MVFLKDYLENNKNTVDLIIMQTYTNFNLIRQNFLTSIGGEMNLNLLLLR